MNQRTALKNLIETSGPFTPYEDGLETFEFVVEFVADWLQRESTEALESGYQPTASELHDAWLMEMGRE